MPRLCFTRTEAGAPGTLLSQQVMDAQIHSVLILFSIALVASAAYSYWSIRRRRRLLLEARLSQTPTHGPWLRKADQESAWLLHEERYFLRPEPGKNGALQVLREERYFGMLSGSVIASIPPRPIAEATSLSEGRDILNFFREVSVSEERAA